MYSPVVYVSTNQPTDKGTNMRFMNEYDIERALFTWSDHPVLCPAVRTLAALRDCANANSDGWHMWPKPARSAAKLMELIERDGTFPYRHGDREDATEAELRKALTPVRRFRTTSGLQFPIFTTMTDVAVYDRMQRDRADRHAREAAIAMFKGLPAEVRAKLAREELAAARLEYLRGELRAETLSYGELAELQSLAEYIEPGDVELAEAAGLPEGAGPGEV